MTALSFAYLETGRGFDEYLAHRQAVGSQLSPRFTESWPDSPDNWYWTFWGYIHDFDPMPYWREVVDTRGIPSFIGYGELDESDNVPVKASVQRLESEFEGAMLTVRVYPGTGHSLMDETLMKKHEYKLVDGLSHDLDTWIESNLMR